MINSAQAKGGNIIIPAFAIERTQDFISYLNILQTQGKIPVLPIYIDSPLAVAATEIFRNNPENFDQESRDLIKSGRNPLKMDNLHFSITAEESRELNNIYGGAIIISASGMADAGRIRHHLKHNLWRKDATVIFVGFQAEGTLGRKLIDGEKQVTIHGETIAVEADVVQLPSFSSHADRDELFKWVEAAGRKAEQIILVHGEGSSIEDFAILLEQELGKKPFIPDLGDCLEFKNNTIVVSKAEKPWLQAMEEKLNRRISRTGETVRKAGNTRKGRGINLARINHAYADIRTNLKLFYERGRAERDYGLLLHTFAEISRILKESENPAEPQIPERFRKKNRR